MKWEYSALDLKQNRVAFGDTYEVLKQAGLEEWELVSVDNGIAYFKRPLRTKSEAEILAHFDYPQQDRSSEV